MKIFLLIISTLIALFIVFQLYITMAKSETQAYTVIKEEKGFEIRYYPSCTMAMITSSANTYRELGSSGFRKLAGYIFGGNEDKKHIAITSPVHLYIHDSVSTMAFVMPANYTKDNLPLPNDTGVTIKMIPEEYVAAIQFGGFASADKIAKYTKILQDSLKEHHIGYYGNFRFLGYNPPYQLFGRRNEIVVAVNWDSK